MCRFPLPGPWCICMWAFARAFLEDYSYMSRLDCAATNLWVLHGYDIANKNETLEIPKVERALRKRFRDRALVAKNLPTETNPAV